MAEHPHAAVVRRLGEAFASGDMAAATGTRGGRTLRYRVAEIYHVRNGKITERWAFSDDTAAIIAFFG